MWILGAIGELETVESQAKFFVKYIHRTILPISRRLNLTKFEHFMSIGVAMNPFEAQF